VVQGAQSTPAVLAWASGRGEAVARSSADIAIATRRVMRQDTPTGLKMVPFLLETPASNTVWIMIAVCGATVLYAIFRPSARQQARSVWRSPHPARAYPSNATTERQMESLLVELSEMARQISAQLDTRSQNWSC